MRGEAEDFVARLLRRRPELKQEVAAKLGRAEGVEGANGAGPVDARALETIVSEQRPVFFAGADGRGRPTIDLADATIRGAEASFLKEELQRRQAVVAPLLSRIGRIDVEGMAGTPFVGTGWIIDDGIVVTNRHVAEIIARRSASGYSFRMGAAGQPISLSFATGHLKGEAAPGISIPVASVLYIEPEQSAVDIAFLKLSVVSSVGTISALPIRVGSIAEAAPLCVVGYPARASSRVIPDQALMQELYRGVYDVKRVAPGFVARQEQELIVHDCTTLGGNSGSALVVMQTGEVAGLHFAGIYLRENQAVPASLLRDYRERRRWTRPPVIETSLPAPAVSAPAEATTITITITVRGGAASVAVGGEGKARSVDAVESAAAAFLRIGPRALLAARLGYGEDEGGPPLIVAAVPQSRLHEAPGWPASFEGIPVRYEAATLSEQIEARADVEAAGDISYDDDARRKPEFSLDPITEEMSVRAHLSPEYGFEELQAFFVAATGPLDSAMYEIQGVKMAQMLAEALARGVEIELTADRKSEPPQPGKEAGDDPLTAEVSTQFEQWKDDFQFRYQIVPLGRRGLVASAYHIKVTVDKGGRFWLSSGNWKNGSSQPLVDEAMRQRATETDLPGNRDWHIIADSATLAERFRNHIRQDFKRSGELAHREAPELEPMVLVPALVEAVEERKPPSRVLAPLDVSGLIKAQPLLTPDRDGRAYTEPMLALIKSARHSLLFQIPYIGMRPDPSVHRGNIDELIDALVEKLKTLEDARLLLRVGNDGFSDNRHVSWYLRSRGVDTSRVKQLADHHTKGMVVDGQRVMIGSHNWSSQGVSVNRDASIIFNEPRLAGYFGEAFEVDWDRAGGVKEKRFVREMPELVLRADEAVAIPAGFALKPLSEVLSEVDD
ncbi:phospholipase D-like domain-containing protein [Mesorhizobium sp.]|uniref:phospholipase D-like domain-containing protein n=1 Tax=Mesorhizobium sp. TaxID=1871066 RepID=UPI0025EDDD19|nr:phospholipase D-like domain-containing protein [Mesorhizobium sp.]